MPDGVPVHDFLHCKGNDFSLDHLLHRDFHSDRSLLESEKLLVSEVDIGSDDHSFPLVKSGPQR
jgi:hypothetical protein